MEPANPSLAYVGLAISALATGLGLWYLYDDYQRRRPPRLFTLQEAIKANKGTGMGGELRAFHCELCKADDDDTAHRFHSARTSSPAPAFTFVTYEAGPTPPCPLHLGGRMVELALPVVLMRAREAGSAPTPNRATRAPSTPAREVPSTLEERPW
jgi:hypothetical protein